MLRIPADFRHDTLTVDDRESVALPRVGSIRVSGLAPAALSDSIRALYRALLRVEDITIIALKRVSVLGEVRAPGIYYLELGSSVRDAVAMAKGVTDIGNPCCLTVVSGATTRRLVDWQTQSGAILDFSSGDAIVVDRESWFKRNGLSIVSNAMILVSTLAVLRR